MEPSRRRCFFPSLVLHSLQVNIISLSFYVVCYIHDRYLNRCSEVPGGSVVLLLAAEQFCEHVQEIIVRFRLALLPSFEPFGKCAIFLFHLKELLCSHMLSQSKSPVLLLKWPFILSAAEHKLRKNTTSWVHCLALYSG